MNLVAPLNFVLNSPSVCVVGLGYVGLPTACLFASAGIPTIGYDKSEKRLSHLRSEDVSLDEPGLVTMLRSALDTGYLTLTETPLKADSYVICVPTPLNKENMPDLGYVISAAAEIAPRLEGGELVVLESTSPIGTTQLVLETILKLNSSVTFDSGLDSDIFIAYCPERVLPGNALVELRTNPRVIGGLNEASTQRAVNLFSIFCAGELSKSEARVAEAIKLAENAFRDVNLAFANELSEICTLNGIDVRRVIAGANQHPRVQILQPGIGVGGHCISVDPLFLISSNSMRYSVIREARLINDQRPFSWAAKLKELIAVKHASNVLLLGLAYKPNSGDLRNSPAVDLTRELAMNCPRVLFEVSEPWISEADFDLLEFPANVSLTTNIVSHKADLKIELVNHEVFQTLGGDSELYILPGQSIIKAE